MRKFISCFTAFALVLSVFVPLGANASVNDDESLISFVSALDIMKGDPDGNFRLDDYVTRAEFTKVAIAASVHKNSVASRLTVSPYPDVTYTHWAAPYVSVAVNNGLVNGYEDSTFRPENNVSLEEAVTIVLKMLGYTSADFGSSWPYGQMGMANNLDLTDDIDRVVGEALTRRDVAQLISNLMKTRAKNSGAKYITLLDYDIIEGSTIIATANEDTAVGSDKVYTTAGTFEIDDGFDYSIVGRKGDLVVKNGSKYVGFMPDNQIVKEYSVYQVMADDVIVSNGGVLENLSIDSSVTVYNKSNKTNLKSILSAMAPGDVISTYRNANGVIDYALVRTGETEGPFVVRNTSWISTYSLENMKTFMRNGSKVSSGSIAVNDVIYYSKSLGTVWAYSDSVTGVYESAIPNKDMPTSVVISGKAYEIEGADAYNALSSNGSYNFGDTVTVLLGRTGSIAGIASQSSVSSVVYGLLESTGTKSYTGANGNEYTSNYISIMLTNGSLQEYITPKDYSSYINCVVSVSFKNGNANITPMKKQSTVYGKVNASKYKIGNFSLAENVEILDIANASSTPGKAIVTYLSRIDGLAFTTADILYFTKNTYGEIDKLFLNDVTGDVYSYGYVTSAISNTTGMSGISGSYAFDVNGSTYMLNGKAYNISKNTIVKLLIKGNSVVSYNGGLVKLSGGIKGIDYSYITTSSGEKYPIGKNVSVYYKNASGNMENVHIEDVVEGKYAISAYYDKEPSRGGRIRVIIAQ